MTHLFFQSSLPPCTGDSQSDPSTCRSFLMCQNAISRQFGCPHLHIWQVLQTHLATTGTGTPIHTPPVHHKPSKLDLKICQIYLLHPTSSSIPNPHTTPSNGKQQPGLFLYIPPIYALHSRLNKAFRPPSRDSIPSRLHSSAYKGWYTLDFASAWDSSYPAHTHTSVTLISTLQKGGLFLTAMATPLLLCHSILWEDSLPPSKSLLHLKMIVPFSREWCAFVRTLKSSPSILGEDTEGSTSSQLLRDLGYADLSICRAQHPCLLQGLDIVLSLYEVPPSCHLDLIQVLAEMWCTQRATLLSSNLFSSSKVPDFNLRGLIIFMVNICLLHSGPTFLVDSYTVGPTIDVQWVFKWTNECWVSSLAVIFPILPWPNHPFHCASSVSHWHSKPSHPLSYKVQTWTLTSFFSHFFSNFK